MPSKQFLPEALPLLTSHMTWDDFAVFILLALSAVGYITRHHHLSKPDPYNNIWYQRPQQAEVSQSKPKKDTRNIAKKLDEAGKDVVIFWGSQSGTAERFAQELQKKCLSIFKMEALVADLSDFDHESIAYICEPKFAIFILSTFGEGDPSDNALDFMSWLTSLPNDVLKSLRYAAFGLGNSNYKYYNKVVDVAAKSLNKAGARLMLPVGRADNVKGMSEEDFLDWTEELFDHFKSNMKLEEHASVYQPMTEIIEADCSMSPRSTLEEPTTSMASKKAESGFSRLAAFPIKTTRDLFQDTSSDRRCIHMEFDLSGLPDIKYKTGDHLAVWPVNPDQEVERLITVLDLQSRKDTPVIIRPLSSNGRCLKVPALSTILALFQYHLDICAPVSRTAVLALMQCAPKPEIKLLLASIANDKATYAVFLQHHHLNFGRLLEFTGVSWSHLPLSFIIESLNPMLPRYYSISSSSIVNPRYPSITAVVSKTPLAADPNVQILGLATSYLSALTPLSANDTRVSTSTYPLMESNAYLYAQVRKSKFKLPASNLVPLILVAAGTGLAPFRGFLQDRARLASMGREIGLIYLAFGCRKPEEDFIYGKEIEDLRNYALKGKLTVQTAFSRSASHHRMYVQDRLCHADNIGNVFSLLLNEEASLYICGSAAMARDVTAKLADGLKSRLDWNEDKIRQWFETMRRTRRYQEDVWG